MIGAIGVASFPLLAVTYQMVKCQEVTVEVVGPMSLIFLAALGAKSAQKFAK